jgi:hypothetical protein
MNDIGLLEECYKRYVTNLASSSPEGILQVDMKLLKTLNLADTCYMQMPEYELNYSFHFLETEEKITLWNDRFMVWIVPESQDGQTSTYVMIALKQNPQPKLELVFVANGVFNNSQLILRILEKFLSEIEENEGELKSYLK